MKPEQRVIAGWLNRMREQTGWSWKEWAQRAKIGAPTTVSRAVKEDYDSVTKIETLHALARAAGVPSVLDFIASEKATTPAINAESMKGILVVLLQLAPKGGWTEQNVEHLVQALEYGLGLVGTDPAKPANSDETAVAARAAAVQFRALAAQ